MIFRFKQFTVNQADCTMKVNTDGVLLGAVATADKPQHILDIGTGTGVIALMLAQRFSYATIDAIDIDAATSALAVQNFQNSTFKNRIQGYYSSFQNYFKDHPENRYELIVSNPPFFIDALPSAHISKKLARHTGLSFFEEMVQAFSKHLSLRGTAWLILPCEVAQKVQEIGLLYDIFTQKTIQICSFPHSKPHRILIEMGRLQKEIDLETIVIYNQPKEYSEQYKNLLKDFLTIF